MGRRLGISGRCISKWGKRYGDGSPFIRRNRDKNGDRHSDDTNCFRVLILVNIAGYKRGKAVILMKGKGLSVFQHPKQLLHLISYIPHIF